MEDPARGLERSETLIASAGAAGPTRSAPAELAHQGRLEPGARIDHYEVIEFLGEGSMGQVYRARDIHLVREVALKRIHPGRWDVMIAQVRLHREAQAMARVEHHAVIQIHDISLVEGELFVAMELARGGTLAEWTRGGPRRWRDLVRKFVEAGRGLAAAHHVGLVHRDIKPSNILLDAHGRAKIGDFGLARMSGTPDHDGVASALSGLDATSTGGIAGTLAYMAPEQLAGGPIDVRADQFSFCVALWESLCGKRPFPDVQGAVRSPEAFVRAISSGSLEGPRSGVQVPRRILAVVRRGLSADRSQRWESMGDLLDALERAARPRRAWFVWAAAIATGIALTAAFLPSSGHTVAVVCSKRAQIAAIWNENVRARYLSRADLPAGLEDAGWFDWYARELDAAYATSCGSAEAPRIACLDDAVEDLRAAIGRTERWYWPRLRAIDRCGVTLHEIDIGDVANKDGSWQLSPDGRQLATSASTHRPAIVRELASNRSHPLDLPIVLRWRRDGSIVGLDDHGQITVIDPATHHRIRTLEASGYVIDVASDLSRVARWAGGELSFVPADGGAPIVEPVSFPVPTGGSFSPDDRRFAIIRYTKSPTLHIDNLVSKHRETIAFRVDLGRFGLTPLRWLDPTSFVVCGSATSEIAADLWRLRVDAKDDLVGPPQIVRRAERGTVLCPQDAQAGKLLIEKLGLSTQNILLDGKSSVVLPSSTSRFRPRAADGGHGRVLGATDDSSTRWGWMSLDGSSVEPIAALDGLSSAAVRSSGLSALDLRNELPVYVEFDPAENELARVPIEAARGARPTLRCGESRCVVEWVASGAAFLATLENRTAGVPVRITLPALATAGNAWEIAPDGKRIAFGTSPYSIMLRIYDLEHASVDQVTSKLCYGIQHGWFLPDGALAYSCFTQSEFAVVTRNVAGEERIVLHGGADSWISGGVSLADHRMIVSTQTQRPSLVLLESP